MGKQKPQKISAILKRTWNNTQRPLTKMRSLSTDSALEIQEHIAGKPSSCITTWIIIIDEPSRPAQDVKIDEFALDIKIYIRQLWE